MNDIAPPSSIVAYYRAALVALRSIEEKKPTGRRFDAEADARWAAFRGDLTTADRIDLLVRDANAQWPGAFGSRNVFARIAVAEDEAFGAGWPSLDAVDAEEVWRAERARPVDVDVAATLRAAAAAWGIAVSPFAVGDVGAADRLVVAGPAAIVAVVGLFSQRRDLGFTDQVVVVASAPGPRQLALLSAALLNLPTATSLATATTTARPGSRLVVSDDAASADAAFARRLAGAA